MKAPRAFRSLLLFSLLVTSTVCYKIYSSFGNRTFITFHGKEMSVNGRISDIDTLRTCPEFNNKFKLSKNAIIVPYPFNFFGIKKGFRIVSVRTKTLDNMVSTDEKVLWQRKSRTNLRPYILQKVFSKTLINELKITYHDDFPAMGSVLRSHSVEKIYFRLVLPRNAGRPKEIFDLSACKKLNMLATAYYPGDPLAWREGTTTYLGLKMRRGIVAVDPEVIPLKTRVFVPGYGYGFAGDTGSAIIGRRIDLGVNDAAEEKEWMHKRVRVYLLDKTGTW